MRHKSEKSQLIEEIRAIYRSLKRKHPRGAEPVAKMGLADLALLRADLWEQRDKQKLITQIQALNGGKTRHGKKLESFTLEDLQIHFVNLRREEGKQGASEEFIPAKPPAAARSVQVDNLTLTLTFSGWEALRAFMEQMSGVL